MLFQMFTLICVLIAIHYIYYQAKLMMRLALKNSIREKIVSGAVSAVMAVILSFYAIETSFDVNFGLAVTALLVCLLYSGIMAFMIGYTLFGIWTYAFTYTDPTFSLEVYILVSLVFIVVDIFIKDYKIHTKGVVVLFILSLMFFLNIYVISNELNFAVTTALIYLGLTTISLLVAIGIIRYQQNYVRLYKRLAMEATHDSLTGLPNRRSFEETINQLDPGSEVSMLMIDIDYFKKINDVHGHPVGDLVLKETAAALRDVCSEKETVARTGGEEFALILRDQTLDTATSIAEKIRASIESLDIIIGDEILKITISIGVAGYPSQADSIDDLYALADEHLYIAKKLGRNQVCCEKKQSIIVE